jgi:ADP-heptose:LPS heptosyltransferase
VAARLPDVVWIRGPAESEEADWTVPTLDHLDLTALCALAARCRAWLGPDSGPSHLAAAAGARVGVVFTDATDPVQWAPLGATLFRGDAAAEAVAEWVLTQPTS